MMHNLKPALAPTGITSPEDAVLWKTVPIDGNVAKNKLSKEKAGRLPPFSALHVRKQ